METAPGGIKLICGSGDFGYWVAGWFMWYLILDRRLVGPLLDKTPL